MSKIHLIFSLVILTNSSIETSFNSQKKYKVNGVIHSFSGSLETAKTYIDMGFLLGVNGVIHLIFSLVILTNSSIETSFNSQINSAIFFIKETKVLNDNYNKSIDLSTMALKLKEDIANDLYSANVARSPKAIPWRKKLQGKGQ